MFMLEEQRDEVSMSETEKTQRLQVLLTGMEAIHKCKSIQAVARQSIHTLKALLHADGGAFLLLDSQKGDFNDLKGREYKKQVPVQVQKKIGTWVLQQQKSYYTEQFDDFDHRYSFNTTLRSVVAVPLTGSKKHPLGVIEAFTFTENSAFDKEALPLVKILGRYVSQVVESRQHMESMQADLKEKELLMTEIHHRLKNNLSTITSLIDIDLSDLTDQKSIDILQRTSARLKSLTEVHSLLYQIGMVDHVDLETYFHNLSDKIAKTLLNDAKPVSIIIESSHISLDAERAMTCGLILNELIINAYKHAFPYMQGGQIIIRAREEQEEIHIEVSDNGQGIKDNFSMDKKTSMGWWVIKALADRLNASIEVRSENGMSYSMRFPR